MKRQDGGFSEDMAGLNRGMSMSRSTGQLVKGSTRPLVQVSRSQAKIATMLQQLALRQPHVFHHAGLRVVADACGTSFFGADFSSIFPLAAACRLLLSALTTAIA